MEIFCSRPTRQLARKHAMMMTLHMRHIFGHVSTEHFPKDFRKSGSFYIENFSDLYAIIRDGWKSYEYKPKAPGKREHKSTS